MWSKMDRNSCSFLTEWTSVLASSLSLVKEAGLEYIKNKHTHTHNTPLVWMCRKVMSSLSTSTLLTRHQCGITCWNRQEEQVPF